MRVTRLRQVRKKQLRAVTNHLLLPPRPCLLSPSVASPTTWPPPVPVQLSPVPPDSGGPRAHGAGSTHTCPGAGWERHGCVSTGRGGLWSNAPSSAPGAGRSDKGAGFADSERGRLVLRPVTGQQSRCQGPGGQPTRLCKVRGSHMLSLSALDLEMTSQPHTRRPTLVAWVGGAGRGEGSL